MVAIAHSKANEQGMGLVPAASGAAAIPTLLGRSAMRIPVGGRIRAGIKVLTRRAAESARAREVYEAGVAEGRGFDAIERELAAVLPDLKNPLTPKNVPYFTVRGEDFPNPELARQIMDLYAEDRGDGVMRLYRFPVVFPADAWQHVMPHELVTWTSSERRFWSEYSEDGQTRYCKTYEQPPATGEGRRVVRMFGGRKVTLRPQNSGVCDPETCAEYQTKRCNLSGRFIFFIPGIKSISAFELPTNSFYAMQAAIEKFQTIAFMRGGRISGFLDGQRTPFFISKRLVEVSRIDEEGKPGRVTQWLIELEAPVDPTALLRNDDGLDAVETRATEAAIVLQGQAAAPTSAAPVVSEDGVIEMPVTPGGATKAAPEQMPVVRESNATQSGPSVQPATTRPGEPPRRDAPVASKASGGESGAEGKEVAWLFDAAAALGVEAETYERYATKRWGQGWKKAAGGRKRALEDLTPFQDNPTGFVDKVNAELDVWA
jgi:Recombination directionality factor-like